MGVAASPAYASFQAAKAKASVASRFQKLLARVEFTEADRQKYSAHRISVLNVLWRTFATNRPLVIGSAKRGSAIRQTSDIDLLLILKIGEVRWGDGLVASQTILDRIKATLRARFPVTTIGRDQQAVVVDFADGRYSVDVVPAVFWRFLNKKPIYQIPDGAGGWMPTSPETHDAFIRAGDFRSGGKLKNVAKLLKFWRSRRIPELSLSSFHAEMLLAEGGLCIGAKTYAECLVDVFRTLASRRCRALQDPCDISPLIYAANTVAKRETLNTAVDSSLYHAEAALLAQLRGDTAEAVRQWNIVFNYEFPS